MMIDIICTIAMCIFVALFVIAILGIITTMFQDTETFKAIDEKLARLLRKNEEGRQ